jgi:hypothetical protein
VLPTSRTKPALVLSHISSAYTVILHVHSGSGSCNLRPVALLTQAGSHILTGGVTELVEKKKVMLSQNVKKNSVNNSTSVLVFSEKYTLYKS